MPLRAYETPPLRALSTARDQKKRLPKWQHVYFFFLSSSFCMCGGFAPVKYYGGQFGGRPSSREKNLQISEFFFVPLQPKNDKKS